MTRYLIKTFSIFAQYFKKYRNDERIWSITGTNFQRESKIRNASYFYSKYPSLWGWASWKRSWDKYDVNIKNWPDIEKNGLTKNMFEDDLRARILKLMWNNIYYKNHPDTWCYQWTLACFLNNGLNRYIQILILIKNIGFGVDATHTIEKKNQFHLAKNT